MDAEGCHLQGQALFTQTFQHPSNLLVLQLPGTLACGLDGGASLEQRLDARSDVALLNRIEE